VSTPINPASHRTNDCLRSIMARRPSIITQGDVARAIRAAKQAGAAEVEVRVGDHSRIIIRISPSTDEKIVLEEPRDIVL
jgi:hypothetical protein